jgi:arylformamidase
MLYDLSPRIEPTTPVWPGDMPYRCVPAWSIESGAAVNVTTLHSTPHVGAHVDAPFHFDSGGATAAELPLEPYLGPCLLIDLPRAPLVLPEHLRGIDLGRAERLLIRTNSVGDRRRFGEDFTALSPAAAALLAAHGVRLVGVDSPSMDPFASKTLDAHKALWRGGVGILEGLVLEDVPVGEYELIALPLRLAGACASPVRAVLRAPR